MGWQYDQCQGVMLALPLPSSNPPSKSIYSARTHARKFASRRASACRKFYPHAELTRTGVWGYSMPEREREREREGGKEQMKRQDEEKRTCVDISNALSAACGVFAISGADFERRPSAFPLIRAQTRPIVRGIIPRMTPCAPMISEARASRATSMRLIA